MTSPQEIAAKFARTLEMQQQDRDIAEDERARADLDSAFERFNARCELRGFPKWELMPVKEKP